MQTTSPERPEGGSAAEARRSEEYLAAAVHELRSPVTVMIGAAKTLAEVCEGVDLPAHGDDLIALLVRSGDRLERLIHDLLSSAYIEHGSVPLTVEQVPLRPILGLAVSGTEAAAGDVDIECDPHLHAMVDAERLEQIVTNLVSNALEHGALPVEVTGRTRLSGQGAEIIVRDHGAGVPLPDSLHLFDRFSSVAARRSSSTGLGLSIARGLARAMGGDIVYARADPGSKFIVVLPAA